MSTLLLALLSNPASAGGVLDAAAELVGERAAATEGGAPPELGTGKHPPVARTPLGILRVDDTEYRVPRSLWDETTGNLKSVLQLAGAERVADADGSTAGWRLGGIERGSLAHQLGLHNGDVVHKVGSHTLGSIPDALAAYGELGRQEEVQVVLTRRSGARRTHTYVVE